MGYAPKNVGETCSNCKQGKYVRNPKTQKVFCERKCWLNGTKTPVQPENSTYAKPEAIQNEIVASLEEKVATLEMALANMRVWASKVEKRLSGAETLLEGMQMNKSALPLHQSFTPHDVHEIKTTDDAAAIVESYNSDPEIPTINVSEVPKGFDK